MKLDNKEDKKIKRFLSSISEDKKVSKINNSIHYFITLDNVLKDIRFSDHITYYKGKQQKILDIIKLSEEYYLVVLETIQRQVHVNDIYNVIKSFVYLYDIVREEITRQNEEIKNYAKVRDALNLELLRTKNQYKNEICDVRAECNERILEYKNAAEEVKSYVIERGKTINELQTKISELNNQIKSLTNNCEVFKSKYLQATEAKDKVIRDLQSLVSEW